MALGKRPVGNFTMGIGSNLAFPAKASAKRDRVVILQIWKANLARQMKRANPHLKVLAIVNLSSMVKAAPTNGLFESGVTYAEADRAHPDFFLKNTSGQRFTESGYNWVWMADVGNPGYQQLWASNVIRMLKTGPWDGVFTDDTNTTIRYYVNPKTVAKYPTDGAYQAATRSMLAAVSPRLHAAGEELWSNFGDWVTYPDVVRDWLQFVDGGMDQQFGKWGTTPGQGYRDPGGWRTQVGEIQTAESMHKGFLAVTNAAAGDTSAIRYGFASALLAGRGHTNFYADHDSQAEVWIPDYQTDVGSPTSGPRPIAGGAYKRTFTRGLVLVNPTTHSVPVSFGGTFSGSGLANASSATMGPHTGLVLHSPTAHAAVITAAVEAESFPISRRSNAARVQDPQASQQQGVKFRGRHGATTRRVRTRHVRTIVVRAKASPCASRPLMRVRVSGRSVLFRRVLGSAYRDYRVRVSLGSGLHRIRLSASGSKGGCGAAVTVDKISFVSRVKVSGAATALKRLQAPTIAP